MCNRPEFLILDTLFQKVRYELSSEIHIFRIPAEQTMCQRTISKYPEHSDVKILPEAPLSDVNLVGGEGIAKAGLPVVFMA